MPVDAAVVGELRRARRRRRLTDVDFFETLPDVVRLGVAYRVSPDLELRSDVQYERWSVLDQQCVVNAGSNCNINGDGSSADPSQNILLAIPRHWHDTIRWRGGLGYWLEKDTEVVGSVGANNSAAPGRYIDPEIFDSFNIFGALGLRHAFSEHFIGAVSYNILYFLPLDVASGSSRINTFQQPTKSPAEDGHYTSTVQFLNLNGTYLF